MIHIICRKKNKVSFLYFISYRFTLLPSLSLVTPLRRSETTTSPLTRCWGRPTSVSERTGASTSSVSRYNILFRSIFFWLLLYTGPKTIKLTLFYNWEKPMGFNPHDCGKLRWITHRCNWAAQPHGAARVNTEWFITLIKSLELIMFSFHFKIIYFEVIAIK